MNYTFKYLKAFKTGLKVIHINRKKLDLENEARLLWENVLKPKWEMRFSARADKLKAELISNGKNLPPEFISKNETIELDENRKIVIEIDGNKLNISHVSKNGVKNKVPKR